MTQKITSVNIETATLNSFVGPTIANVSIANSTYVLLDDTAVSNTGGYAVITGNNFSSGAQVLFGSASATSVTYVDSSTLRVQVPALTAGSYVVYVQNTDGSTAVRLNGITSSPIPVWATGSTLTDQDSGAAISISLSATSDSSVIYSVANGSSLPSGTTLAANGLFSGTITPVDETTYNFTVDAIDTENQEASRSFSITITVGDQYYYLTTLHLTGEPPENTWISDISTNKFILTANSAADTKPVAFSPFETVWSNFFDGTGDFLSLANNAALNPGTQDFLMEAWVYITGTTGANQGINGKGTAGTDGYSFYITNALVLSFIWNGTGGTTITAGTLSLNNWNHVAVVRNSNVIRLYLNGTGAGSSTACTTDITSTATKYIGQARGANPILGYISNYRMIKGTLPSGYDATSSTITVPTPPLTAVTNTSILTCQSNRLIDNSANNFTLTKGGDVTVTNFGPFVETDTTTGSAYFDGVGDYISSTSNTAFTFTGDFTVEYWHYDDGSSVSYPNHISSTDWATGTGGVSLRYNNTGQAGKYSFHWYNVGDPLISSVSTFPIRVWNHVALTRSGSTITLFVNGSFQGTASNSGTVDFNLSSNGIKIGGGNWDGVNSYMKGYLSNIRMLKGTALYTNSFTPPTSPLTAIENTSLLTLQTRTGENNSRIIDTSGINSFITRSGNTTQGIVSPLGLTGWSNYFDGTADFLTTATSSSLAPTGDFTIECWFHANALTSSNSSAVGLTFIGNSASNDGRLQTAVNPDGSIYFYLRNNSAVDVISLTTATGLVTIHSWNHVAFVRNGNVYTTYLNGSNVAATSSSTAMTYAANTLNIGFYRASNLLHYWNGYISNFRLVNGTAVYTSNFTPSSITGLTAISNTTLLTCQTNSIVDKSTANSGSGFSITRTGDVSVQPFSPFRPTGPWQANTVGGSIYFDGNADFLTIASSNTIALSTGDFTWESWIYLDITTVPSFVGIYDQRNGTNGAGVIQPVIELTSTNGYAWYVAAGNRITSGSAAVKTRSWQHLAVCRSSGTTKMFIDGVQVGAPYTDTNNYPAGSLTIGRENDGVNTRYFTGYLSGLRVIKGQALYTANTTPPTTPSTSTANTVLLLSGTNGAIFDSTGKNTLESSGNLQTSTSLSKFSNNSMYFDGTGDYLQIPASPLHFLGTGDFTIEAWIYSTTIGAARTIFSIGTSSTTGLRFYINSSNQVALFDANASRATAGTISVNTWHYVAVVRSGTTLTCYLDGVAGTPATYSASIGFTNQAAYVGRNADTLAQDWIGYIEDLRVTKYARTIATPSVAFKTK